MTKFNKNIVLKPDLITFIIYIVLVCLYQGIIDVQDSIRDPKIASDAIQECHFYRDKCHFLCESSSWRNHAYP